MQEEEVVLDIYVDENEDETDWDSSVVANSTRLMMKQIGQLDLLTPEEEKELIIKAKCGDLAARNRLVECNMRLVASIAGHYKVTGLTFMDLMQEGSFGLIDAINKFDLTRDIKFSTYATYWIRQKISRAVCEQNRIIYLPAHISDLSSKIKKATVILTQQLGHEPNNAQIAAYLRENDKKLKDITADNIKDIKESLNETLSLDVSVNDDDDATVGDLVQDMRFELPENSYLKNDRHEQIEKVLDTLTEKEAKIIKMRFGLDGNPPMTLAEIGKEFNCSREWIRVQEEKAMRKLRSPLRKNMLKDYLD